MSRQALSRLCGLAFACATLLGGMRSAHAQAVLNFWDMAWGPPEYTETAKKIIGEFNADHHDISVRYRSVPWSNYYQTFVTAVGAGTPPDISTGSAFLAAQLYGMGAIQPLDDVVAEMKASGDAKDFAPGSIERLRYNNHYLALPWAIDIRVWLYRKDLLAAANVQPPHTWAEFRAAAKKLTGNGKYGVVGSGDTGGSHYVYSFVLNNGGGFFDPQQHLAMDTPRDREAMQFISDLVHDGSVSPASAGYDSDERRRAFLSGQAAFILDGPGLPYSAAPEDVAKIGILRPLVGPHGDEGTVAWVNNIMLYKQSKYPEQAKVFLKWWSQHQLPLWTAGHVRPLPARLSFRKDPFFANDPFMQEIVKDYDPIGKSDGQFAIGIFPNLATFEGGGPMYTLIQELLQGKPVAGAIEEASGRLNSMMK